MARNDIRTGGPHTHTLTETVTMPIQTHSLGYLPVGIKLLFRQNKK